MALKYGRTVLNPNLGLIYDQPTISVPSQGLKDGMNFRVKNGTLESLNLGWVPFTDTVLDGPVWLIDNFFPREAPERLIFGSVRDIYIYNDIDGSVSFITPIYAAGTATAAGTSVAGSGTSWLDNVKAGDMIHFGSATQDDPDAVWYEIANVDADNSIDLTTSAGTIPAGPYTIRKRFTDLNFPSWSYDTFVGDGDTGDDLWLVTNGVDPVATWNGTDQFLTSHPELGFTAGVVTTFSNMVIYGNIVQNGKFLPSTIINSDLGLPLHAGATGTGISEQFVVHSGTDEILNMIPLGDYLVIYSERTIVPAQFVGDPLIFLFRVALSGVGPISGNALADFGDFHEFIGSDAGYMFDGVTLRETNSHVWRYILRQADPLRRGQVFGHFDEEQGDLIWSVPSNTDPVVGEAGAPPDQAFVEHYLEAPANPNFEGSPFSRRKFPFTIGGFYQRNTGLTWEEVTEQWNEFNFAWNDQFFQLAFPLNIAGDANGRLWVLNQAQTADGDPLPSYVRTGRFPLASGRERDLLTRIYPFAHTLPYMLDVTLFMGDHMSGSIQNKGTQQFDMTLPQGGHFVTFYRRGRVAEFQFGSNAGDPWILDGWSYDKVDGGRR